MCLPTQRFLLANNNNFYRLKMVEMLLSLCYNKKWYSYAISNELKNSEDVNNDFIYPNTND